MSDDLDLLAALRPDLHPTESIVDEHRALLLTAISAARSAGPGSILGLDEHGADCAETSPSAHPQLHERATRRRLVGRAAALVALVSFGAAAVVVLTRDQHDVVTTETPTASTSTSVAEYGFAPLTPLVDTPMPIVPLTELAVDAGHVFSAQSEPGKLGLRLTDPTGAWAGSSVDPQSAPALTSSGSSSGSADPNPRSYIMGTTRAEVARVDLVRESGTISVQTIHNEAFPQLSFFLIDDPEGLVEPGELSREPERPLLVAYAEDGTVLTDSDRIRAEHDEFVAEVDRRQGVEAKQAAIQHAQVSADDMGITLRVFHCGAEPSPTWTESETELRISVTVKLAYSDGDCLRGDTTDIRLGLNEPLNGRTMIDDRTGQPIPDRPATE